MPLIVDICCGKIEILIQTFLTKDKIMFVLYVLQEKEGAVLEAVKFGV